jgi:hypothetical protein
MERDPHVASNLVSVVFLLAVVGGGAAQAATAKIGKLLGAAVYAADGIAVGEVADVATSEQGEVDALRVRTGSRLGFGERIIVIPKGAFKILRKGVLLEFSAEAIGALPSASPDNGAHEGK